VRYTDPTGHVCSDPEDPTPSCENGNPYPNNVTPTNRWVAPSTPANTHGDGGRFGLDFEGDGDAGDIDAFVVAAAQEANAMYEVYCQELDSACEFSSPAELYVATHGTTVITFSDTSGDYCQRDAGLGVTCYADIRGDIDPILAAHEMGHVFNALISNNGYYDPYDALAVERANNPNFPAIDAAITPGYLDNSGSTGEDYANMHSMWVFDDFLDTPGGWQRRQFMNNNMYYWILRLLEP